MAEWITTAEAARISGYTLYHLRYLINEGKVTGKKWGREWQVDKVSLLGYIRKVERLGAKRGRKS